MYDFNVKDALLLSALSYFDILDADKEQSVNEFASQLLYSPRYMDQQRTDLYTLKTLEFLQQFRYDRYETLRITDTLNDNKKSGLVLFVAEDKHDAYVCFRGSEMLDEEYHRCGWEDWEDNFDIFLSVTRQQLLALNYVQNHDFHGKSVTLLGHSKGGNLALCLSLICTEEMLRQIKAVYTFNAPGINPDMLAAYEQRIRRVDYLEKLHVIENEHDVVSSMFKHIKDPLILTSLYNDRNIQQLCHDHQVYAYKLENGEFCVAKGKSRMPKLVEGMINTIFMKQSKEKRIALINEAVSYLHTNDSMAEIYPKLVARIGKYTRIFNDVSYAHVKVMEFDELMTRFRDELHTRALNLSKKIFDVKSAISDLFDKK